ALPPARLVDYLGPTAARTALELSPGQVGGPVRSGWGHHLMHVVAREEAATPPLAAVREEVRAELRRRDGDRRLRRHRDEPRAAAWRVRCPRDSGALRIHSDLLLDVVPSHLHFARVGTSGAVAERVLSDGERDWPLPASPAADGAGLGDYVRLGMAHILTGYDHLVFLFALLLVCGSLGEAARVVTGFTVGHSATLALAALGWVTPAR